MSEQRRLAAIMFTDMVGYTALMGENEDRARELLERSRRHLTAFVDRYHGERLEEVGDATLSVFPSAVEAANCALAIQQSLFDDPAITLRIGIHLGDVVFADGRIYGDGVNVASRIEPLARPGGIAVSEAVGSAIRGHPQARLSYLGRKRLKNVDEPIRVYALAHATETGAVVEGALRGLWARRVPQVLALYAVTGVAIIGLARWLAALYGVHGQWVDGLMTALVAMSPAVIAVAFFRGEPDRGRRAGEREQRWHPGKLAFSVNLAAMLVLVAIVLRDAPWPGEPIASLAVLPLANVSADAGNEYFSDGLTDELINTLSRLDALNVAARTSSFTFKHSQMNVQDVARRLGVDHVLEGSVRKSGEALRVFVQLVDARTGYAIWQQSYEKSLDDVFGVQEDIARSVVSELGLLIPAAQLARLERRPTEDVGAYTFYLQGLDYLHQPDSERNVELAENLFRNALLLDPQYAQAYSGLCRVALKRYEMSNAPRFIDAGEESCRAAMELDESLHEVRVALASLYRETGRLDDAESLFREVVEAAPRRADAWIGLGEVLGKKGGAALARAEEALRRAVALQPADWSTHMALGEFLYWQLRYGEALRVFQTLTDLTPDNHRAWSAVGDIHLLRGDMRKAIGALEKSLTLSPSRSGHRDLGLAYFYLGEYDNAIESYRLALEHSDEDLWSWGDYGDVLRHSGQSDEARRAYRKAAGLARAVLDRDPANWKVQARLALYQFHLDATAEADRLMQEALREGSGIPEVGYYGAQLDALAGRPSASMSKLRAIVSAGFPTAIIAPHPDFQSLHQRSGFSNLVEQVST